MATAPGAPLSPGPCVRHRTVSFQRRFWTQRCHQLSRTVCAHGGLPFKTRCVGIGWPRRAHVPRQWPVDHGPHQRWGHPYNDDVRTRRGRGSGFVGPGGHDHPHVFRIAGNCFWEFTEGCGETMTCTEELEVPPSLNTQVVLLFATPGSTLRAPLRGALPAGSLAKQPCRARPLPHPSDHLRRPIAFSARDTFLHQARLFTVRSN